LNWAEIVPFGDYTYIVGNPPFLGATKRSDAQKEDMTLIFGQGSTGVGNLDYVTAWLLLAAKSTMKTALVATNSVTRGEQVPLLWSAIRKLENGSAVELQFAIQSFEWNNEAPNMAHVYVVILGISPKKASSKKIIQVGKLSDKIIDVKNISPYLVDYDPTFIVAKQQHAPTAVPEMRCGSKATMEI
jgi:hypothetical protein